MSEQVNYTMPELQYTTIKTLIDDLDKQLTFSVDLTDEARASLPKTGDKSLAFVRAAAGLVGMTTEFLPRGFDESEFLKDVELMEKLVDLDRRIQRTAQRINDTLLEVGSEAYVAALVVYKSAKENGRGEELDKAVDEMARRFWRKSTPTPEPTPEG